MKEIDAFYYARREQEELGLARIATTQASRDAHHILAIKYAAKSEASAMFGADGPHRRVESIDYQLRPRAVGPIAPEKSSDVGQPKGLVEYTLMRGH